jgi:tRNA (guanine6-N2)-methyltransferase
MMARSRSSPDAMRGADLPACYAVVHPGLEEVAADEIERDLGGKIKRTAEGLVVFRLDEIDDRILGLRTTEDVFLLAWGTDQLTYRAEDLDKIQRWTAKEPDWQQLLGIHHAIRPKPRGKPTYRLVTQMEGHHAYLRRDAGKALARGLAGHFPASWREAEENASIEVWLSIHEATAVCGLRLSDRTMRHRTWKLEHRPASLRPTMAAALVRLAAAHAGQVVVDPMCGAGTILAEQLVRDERSRRALTVCGGDIDRQAVRAAATNLRRLGTVHLARWDATRLPLATEQVDHIISNPPFGKQLASPEEIRPLYSAMVREYHRVLRRGGQAVLLVSDAAALREAVRETAWKLKRQLRVRILGAASQISVWRKES